MILYSNFPQVTVQFQRTFYGTFKISIMSESSLSKKVRHKKIQIYDDSGIKGAVGHVTNCT